MRPAFSKKPPARAGWRCVVWRPTDRPVNRSPADYWLSAAIDVAATVDSSNNGGQAMARDKGNGKRIAIYHALVVDRAELMKLWPPDNVWRRTGRATARGLVHSVRMGQRKPGED